MRLTADDLTVLAIAAGCVVVVGVLGTAGVRGVRSRSLRASLVAVPLVTLVAVTAAVVVDAKVMFLSGHDLSVVVLALAAATPVAVGLAAWLARGLARSGRELASAARDLGAGRTPGRTPRGFVGAELTAAHEELVEAGRALDAARAREAAMESSRRELVAWVSHDLRTPLAGIRAMAEALEDGVAEDADLYHKQLRVEADRLSAMVDTLFLLSRIHAGALRLDREPVDIGDVVSDVLASARPLAVARAVVVTGDADPDVDASVDVAQLSRALSNMVSNAVRHTGRGGTVHVTARGDDDMVRLTVQDGCGGIPDEEIGRVFDVAWRGEGSRRSAGDAGGGLGLAVTRGIVEAHGGTVTVSNAGAGCRFEVAIPRTA